MDSIRGGKKWQKNLWEYKNKLKGEQIQRGENSTDGAKRSIHEQQEKLQTFWTKIYQKHDDSVNDAWHPEVRREYVTRLREMKGKQKHKTNG